MSPVVERVIGGDRRPRHGYVASPLSRAYWCAQEGGCGPVSAEPQSVEAAKGFPDAGPPDGQLASGGQPRFGVLDGAAAPGGRPWPATTLTAGAPLRMRWWLTAPHRTSAWQYWITRDGWDPNQPLSRSQLEPAPFCQIDWVCPGNEAWRCHLPIADVHHWAYVPPEKRGRHVIYAVWVVGDTANAFYQAIDVEVRA